MINYEKIYIIFRGDCFYEGKMILKYTANVISLSRIVLSIVMICNYKNEPLFVFLYFVCGFTDILDGYIARRTNTQSLIGARIDSIADFFMFGTIIIFVIFSTGDKLRTFLLWIIIIVVVRLANIIIAALKYKSFIILHTWGNKAAGYLFF